MAGKGSNSSESAAGEGDIELKIARALKGNAEKDRAKLDKKNQLTVRERIALLTDAETFVEDGLLANCSADDLPADGVVTGYGKVSGRSVCIVANDSTVKAGSWGTRTVEKIIRMTEYALRHELPIFWLIDSAGARITDQVQMFPGRRGAGRIFSNQVKLSGKVPQMMGGARMHTSISGCADNLAMSDTDAIEQAKMYFTFMPLNWRELPPKYSAAEPLTPLSRSVLPNVETAGYDIRNFIKGLVDDESFFEVKPDWATELVTGFALLDGNVVGVVANNPMIKGGVLFVDSADKAARFVWLCDAYNIPLIFLADVPGFMIGTQVERQGIIRHGAKMITAITEATVPKICVVVRKAYGAGLYAMCGPAFDPIATLALPTAKIAVMGPEAAVNAVYANHIAAITDLVEREAFIQQKRAEYEKDVELSRLASELIIDAVVSFERLRAEVIARFAMADPVDRQAIEKRHGVYPG